MTKLDDAKIAAFAAQAKRDNADARQQIAIAKALEVDLERDLEKREKELASNERHRVYVFDKPVSDASAKSCIDALDSWHRRDPDCAVEIQVNSPGGEIFAGFALIDYIRDFRAQGHTVTMVGLGKVASMAGVLMQAADTRILSHNSLFLIHEGSMGAIGDFGDVEDKVELMKTMHELILDLFVARAQPINKRTTKTFIKNRWKRKDWWMVATDAVELGFADEVR